MPVSCSGKLNITFFVFTRKLILQVSHPASAGDRRFHLWQMLTKHIIGVIYEAQIMRLRNSGDDKISFSVGCLMSCLTLSDTVAQYQIEIPT